LIYDLPSLNVEPHPHQIISQYKEFKDMFEKKNANTLPKHRLYDCTIDLEEKTQPPFEPIYNLSQDELVTLHEYINEIFKKKFIQHSKFLIVALTLFVKKTYGSL
jgi:hypothetical protein